ncbi:hypothetical protein Nepgr_029785 [Nepenthes gracilis]|uniref:Uncharacterized protein n=1 Tax=Nepenthes gracilis TaxID=150966 RepID=A0AAD3Y3B3_NEPGR|nr:hypothetical protein Nepgr_029785 [Nepenthes gracilis]
MRLAFLVLIFLLPIIYESKRSLRGPCNRKILAGKSTLPRSDLLETEGEEIRERGKKSLHKSFCRLTDSVRKWLPISGLPLTTNSFWTLKRLMWYIRLTENAE